MRYRHLTPLLALLALVGCGGDDDASTTKSGGSGTSSTSTSSSSDSEALGFDKVKSFTLEYLKGKRRVNKECKRLRWVKSASQKRVLAPFPGTTTVELLTCDGVPYLAYLDYRSEAAAKKGLTQALLPYVVDEETTVVMALVGLDGKTASRYLKALKAECDCGKVVRPKR